ncbi:MAG: DUF2259 domain-containing protein [Rhizobiaceae bacterium]|nr:DUF2259 domain-containing protein [Rhizobiaceae bacterium]
MASQPSLAAENSTGNSLGFSQDGNYFVFEEYGTTDGLGAPYVNLFAIDIAGDRWIKGTPVRLRGTEEEVIALEKNWRTTASPTAGQSKPVSATQWTKKGNRREIRLGQLWRALASWHLPNCRPTTRPRNLPVTPNKCAFLWSATGRWSTPVHRKTSGV